MLLVKNSNDIFKILGNTAFHWSSGLALLVLNKLVIKSKNVKNYGLYWFGLLMSIRLISKYFQEPKGYNKKPLDLKNKIAIVTGGSNGLGKAIVERLVKKGAEVVVIDLVPLTYDLENVHFFKANLSDLDSIKDLVQDIVAKVGKPHILVNNAGTVGKTSPFDKNTDEDIKRTMTVNLLAPMILTKYVLAHLIDQKLGHIVNIASLAGFVGPAYMAAYCSSKAGFISFHESILNDLQISYPDCSIKTTLVMPGKLTTKLFIEAQNFDTFWMPEQEPEPLAEWIVDELEIHRHHEIKCPTYGHSFPLLRFFGVGMRRFLYKLTRANDYMINYVDKK